jgi:hypothetical protein
MKKYIFPVLIFALTFSAFAQEDEFKYRRSSLYSMLVTYPKQEFNDGIREVFITIPVPEKFNDHELSVKMIASDQRNREKKENIDKFITDNHIARRMVGKWYNRDPETGHFDMNLIHDRGHYDATYFDVALASQTARGVDVRLAEAGEELIGNTFLIVHDVKYLNHKSVALIAGAALAVTYAVVAQDAAASTQFTEDIMKIAGDVTGFGVTVTSYLYRLDWNKEIAAEIDNNYYINKEEFDAAKKKAFDNEKDLFKMKYIGKQSVKSSKTSMLGIVSSDQMIRKVSTRAFDATIAKLQLAHEEFRTKTPIFAIDATNTKNLKILAKIGMKEDVTTKSRFEVLEQIEDQRTGKINYRRVGTIKPVANKIWDNRYMAVEEKTEFANLNITEFERVSGSDFQPGMLIRQIK